jgi:hypothetical protein
MDKSLQDQAQVQVDPMNTPGSCNDLTDDDSSSSDNTTTHSQKDSVTPITRTHCTENQSDSSKKKEVNSWWMTEYYHVIQLCYLFRVGNIEPIIYTRPNSSNIMKWQTSKENRYVSRTPLPLSILSNFLLTSGHSESIDKNDIMVESSMSLMDRHMIHTLSKISENLDQNTLHLTKDSEEKAKRLGKVRMLQEILVHNATENDSQHNSPSEPTDFCRAFLLIITVYRSKEALQQGLKTNIEKLFLSQPHPLLLNSTK